jgi:hypothetical protein
MMSDKTAASAYSTSGLVMYLGTLDWNTICMVGGLVLGILTFAVNWYYKRENSKVYRDAMQKGMKLNEPKE